MTFLDYATIFVATFFLVGLLGLQSKHVQHSKYIAAALTSMAISVSNFVFVHYAATGGALVLAVTAVGGAMGIITSIYVHDNFLMKDEDENISS